MILSVGDVDCLRGRSLEYERSEGSWPLVCHLSDKALLGSYAATDKS